MQYVLLGLAFLAGFLIVVGINFLFVDTFETRRQIVRKRVEEELKLQQRERARDSMKYREMYEMAAEGLGGLHERQGHRP